MNEGLQFAIKTFQLRSMISNFMLALLCRANLIQRVSDPNHPILFLELTDWSEPDF